MKPSLYPYQEAGYRWLSSKRYAYLADEPGLGKTAQAITAADALGAKDIVVVCPAVVRPQWPEQVRYFSAASRPVQTIYALKETPAESGLVVMSFDAARVNADKIKRADVLIVDEAHNIKGIDAAQTKALLGKSGLIHRVGAAWFLSGTPTPNGDPRELWPTMYVCGAVKLRYDPFQDRYCKGFLGPYGYQRTGLKNVEELKDLLDGFMLRRKKEDVMDQLPALHIDALPVEAGPVDEEIYFFDWWRQGVNVLHDRVNTEIKLMETMVETAARARACERARLAGIENLGAAVTTSRRYIALQKAPAVAELITHELRVHAYKKVLVFAVHRDPIVEIRNLLFKEFRAVLLFGGTTPSARATNLAKFKENPKCKVLICNIEAAGTGLDGLQHVCDEIIFLEQDFTPGRNAQAIMRLHRLGQKKRVRVRVAHLAGSVDEDVQRVIRRKTQDIVQIYD